MVDTAEWDRRCILGAAFKVHMQGSKFLGSRTMATEARVEVFIVHGRT